MSTTATVRIVRKQNNSKRCIVCGLSNDAGLFARFYETEEGEVVAVAIPRDHHQSYPGRCHGGVSGALLDETIGRAIMIRNPEIWGVTAELSIRLKKPVPLEEEIFITGRITREGGRIFEGEGEIILKDGTIAATASGKYIKMPIENIITSEDEFAHDEWFLEDGPCPETIELPR
ncbi:MAG: PaaI family thioesterase [Spirochaetales bacterium]|nr:PaaI family thioesterase [Spirochaetales bacterium]